METFWNIRHEDDFDYFTGKIKRSMNRRVNRDIICTYGSGGYPLLVAKGTRMTREVAYRLMKFYCNRFKLFYSYKDLDGIVDDICGVKKDYRREEHKVVDLLAWKRKREAYMNMVDKGYYLRKTA